MIEAKQLYITGEAHVISTDQDTWVVGDKLAEEYEFAKMWAPYSQAFDKLTIFTVTR